MGLINFEEVKELSFEPWELENYVELNALERILETASRKNKYGGGIYRMYDKADKIIYVGKSNDLHRRLLQHVGGRSNTAYFINEVVKIEMHKNDDPVYQTLLEAIFIAVDEPKYNDEVKDRRKKNVL
jgi:excinuclease UvrABC nuclease subunit